MLTLLMGPQSSGQHLPLPRNTNISIARRAEVVGKWLLESFLKIKFCKIYKLIMLMSAESGLHDFVNSWSITMMTVYDQWTFQTFHEYLVWQSDCHEWVTMVILSQAHCLQTIVTLRPPLLTGFMTQIFCKSEPLLTFDGQMPSFTNIIQLCQSQSF